MSRRVSLPTGLLWAAGREGNGRAAAGEDAVVGGEVADETEMRTEPRVGKHAPGIAANGKDLAALDEMMPVELEGIRLLSNASLVGARARIIP